MAWLVEEDGLVPDESHAVGGFDEVSEGLPLFIPNVVMEAQSGWIWPPATCDGCA